LAGLISTAHCAGASGMDADYNIVRGIIEKIGVGRIVRRDKMPLLLVLIELVGAVSIK
jgi:hypothetical protein